MSAGDPTEGLLAAAAAAQKRIARCHEEVVCPRCKAPVGRRCAAMRGSAGGGYAELTVKAGAGPPPVTSYLQVGALTKHPHEQRWTRVVAKR